MSAPNSRWSTGSATFTTVPSMNVMLDPRMVAARTQGAARFEHGASAGPARITASSHVALAMVVKLLLCRFPRLLSSRNRRQGGGLDAEPSGRDEGERDEVGEAGGVAGLREDCG